MNALLRVALAVTLVWLMPWRAARTLRTQDGVIGALADVLVMKYCQPGADVLPKVRHLRVVGQPAGETTPYSGRHLKGVPRAG